MSIPKFIYQTYKTKNLPWLIWWHINKLKKRNPTYTYQFFDDDMVDVFIRENFDDETNNLFKKINIGAAKADFFRYAILYKKGGVYLDIDSLILKRLDTFILPTDNAIIAKENNGNVYVQWGLIFEVGHPFLKKTLDIIIDNLKENKYPYDVHKMTGPSAFTEGILSCLNENKNIDYRELGTDYDGMLKFSYPMSKLALYGFSKRNHWKKQVSQKPVLK